MAIRFLIMAKDPAFLFYSNDFLSGTFTMSDEQVGKYIRLLCLQHQKYNLSEKDMMNICKSYDDDIFSKFIKSDDGYFNERLREVSEKRKAYSDSRRNNRNKYKKETHMNDICKTYDSHMENEIEIENVIINKDISKIKVEKKIVKPNMNEVIEFFVSNGYSDIAGVKAFNYYNEADWKDSKGKKVLNWKQKMRGVWFKDENKSKQQYSVNQF